MVEFETVTFDLGHFNRSSANWPVLELINLLLLSFVGFLKIFSFLFHIAVVETDIDVASFGCGLQIADCFLSFVRFLFELFDLLLEKIDVCFTFSDAFLVPIAL